MNVLLILFGLALAIIQVIMIIKFFEIASDIRAMKNFFLNQDVPYRNVPEKSENRDAEPPANPATSCLPNGNETETKGEGVYVVVFILAVVLVLVMVVVTTGR